MSGVPRRTYTRRNRCFEREYIAQRGYSISWFEGLGVLCGVPLRHALKASWPSTMAWLQSWVVLEERMTDHHERQPPVALHTEDEPQETRWPLALEVRHLLMVKHPQILAHLRI